MRLFKTVAGLRSYLEPRHPGKRIGLVPTMGALHAGHFSLIECAVAETDLVVVSIFVNPLQFAPGEDLDQYPHQEEQDTRWCEQLGVDVVFAPSAQEMETESLSTTVVPATAMTSVLCGPYRPGHFQGVATIVTKLLNIVQPAIAYFGAKDAQQLAIIKRLATDLNLPVAIRACPTVREPSGLAYSSRNQYLSAPEKEQAAALFRSLQKAQQAFKKGERDASKLGEIAKQELSTAPGVRVEYVDLVHPQTLEPLEKVESAGLLGVAGYVGSTRLIDNVILQERQPIIAIDGPAGAGKSTVARRVAQALGLLYLDTGAMYRAVTWLALKSGSNLEDEAAIAELISGVKIELVATDSPDPVKVKIGGEDVTKEIRTPEVTAQVSTIAAQVSVRRELVKQQRRIGKSGGIVAEGRDIGTTVFPQAELKVFLTASVSERAKRRWQELKDTSLEQLQHDIQRRDEKDSTRSVSPLQKAADAIEVNTDNLSVEAVIERIISLYREKELGDRGQ